MQRLLLAALVGLVGQGLPLLAQPADPLAGPIQLRVIGGHAGIRQYLEHEAPFWRRRITELTNGRVTAEITPFDEAGLPGQSMLDFMRLGIAPFGTAILSLASTGDPELHAIDLPALAVDMHGLRQAVDAFRPRLEESLRERYQVELLGIYAYPAQVVFCARPFAGLSDLAGRRIRTSSVGQSELIRALGATPMVIPFTEMVQAARDRSVDCAVTGAMPGHALGLHRVTTHVHALPLNWIISVFGANAAAWAALPEDVRTIIRRGVRELEPQIWAAADRETADGLACNAGRPTCPAERRGSMTVVPVTATDAALLRRSLAEVVLPRWVERCGTGCAETWNQYLAPHVGIAAQPERQ
ncbi:TRAP transporter substrate-binding protein [Falsiroseomonas sp. HC035]|uniref:TRAP transporter substrate-binding protein n=1 Tax=Falsiroseomonas sp. HC035 TaxID=3390999 RepID=UPI003D31D895